MISNMTLLRKILLFSKSQSFRIDLLQQLGKNVHDTFCFAITLVFLDKINE